jgi:hypothetical protein
MTEATERTFVAGGVGMLAVTGTVGALGRGVLLGCDVLVGIDVRVGRAVAVGTLRWGVLLGCDVLVGIGVRVSQAVAVGALAISALMSVEAPAVAFRCCVACLPCGTANQIRLTIVHVEHTNSRPPQPMAVLPFLPFAQIRLTNCIIAVPQIQEGDWPKGGIGRSKLLAASLILIHSNPSLKR